MVLTLSRFSARRASRDVQALRDTLRYNPVKVSEADATQDEHDGFMRRTWHNVRRCDVAISL